MRTVIGLDYGTQAARAVLVDARSGNVLCTHTIRYPHGVMEGDLASAEDYENALYELLERVTPAQYRNSVEGICVDATSLTLVPLAADGRVLAQIPEYKDRHHAQIKLWKNHAAQKQADEALALAHAMNEKFLSRTGGSISSEWTIPKLLKIRDEDPQLYQQIDLAMDLCEFLTYRLTGVPAKTAGSMCYKGCWGWDIGFPSEAFLNGLREGFAEEYPYLMRGPVKIPGERVGYLKPSLCKKLHLRDKVSVATGALDGLTAMVALGAMEAGDGALVVGTSNVLSIQSSQLCEAEGIVGIGLHGMLPGLYGVEIGQNTTGDMLEWYVRNALPQRISLEADERGISVHQVLLEQIEKPWENKVIAVDWWGGSRCAPCDLSLPGIISGLTMNTQPKDIYLALLQAIVCGTREGIEQCAKYGIKIDRVFATGGITEKNPLLMQEYANLLGSRIYVGQVSEGPALGSAIFAAVAAGIYGTPLEASKQMGVKDFTCYEPDEAHRDAYEALYQKNHALRMAFIQLKE